MKILYTLLLAALTLASSGAALTLASSGAAYAKTQQASDALSAGDYAQARSLGRIEATAESLMIACQAGMLMGGYLEKDNAAVSSLHGAMSDCTQVLTMDPDHINARITLAVGLSLEGKRWQKPPFAKTARCQLKQIQADHPDSLMAQGALAGWYSEVSAAGFLARLYLSAKRSDARQYFDAAHVADGHDIPLMVLYVKFLARGNKYERSEAVTMAESVMDIPDNHAANQLMQHKIRGMHTALISEDKNAIEKAIAEATAFYGIEKWRDIPTFAFAASE